MILIARSTAKKPPWTLCTADRPHSPQKVVLSILYITQIPPPRPSSTLPGVEESGPYNHCT